MPHSLVAKLSGLKHKGFITDTEYDRLKKALNSLRVDEMYQLEMENAEEFIPKSVLDKIRAEIETKYGQCDICEYFEDYDYEENDISEYRPIGNIVDILQIIDKYKAESEECFSALRPS